MKKCAVTLIILVVTFFCVCAFASDSGTCGENVIWTLDDEGLLTISGEGGMNFWQGEYTEGYGWDREKVKKVIIKQGVTVIGSCTFRNCKNLVSISIPASVSSFGKKDYSIYSTTAGCRALTHIDVDPENKVYSSVDGTLLSKDGKLLLICPSGKSGAYRIPDGVETIYTNDGTSYGLFAFENCDKITSIWIPQSLKDIDIPWMSCALPQEGILSRIEVDPKNEVFRSENGMLIKKGDNGDVLIVVPPNYNDKLLVVPDNIIEIENWAFGHCSIQGIILPKKVTTIREMAFFCQAKDVYYLGSIHDRNMMNIVDGDIYGGNPILGATWHYDYGQGTDPETISDPNGYYSVSGKKVSFLKPISKGKTFITIPSEININGRSVSVTEIAADACKDCKKISRVKISDSIKKIGENAFSGCVNLSKIQIGSMVEEIGNSAFEKCKKVKEIRIPSSVKKIGSRAFCDCKGLKTIEIETTKLKEKTIGADAFVNISKKVTIICPPNKLKSYKTLLVKKGVPESAKFTK